MKVQRPDHELATAHPIAGSGGLQLHPPSRGDPYVELDDLMAAVEVLCPRWPSRALFDGSEVWVL